MVGTRFGFRRTRAGYECRLGRPERALLRGLCLELGALLEADEGPPPADPLEALVGLSEQTPDRPDDPVLARLLPDAYTDDEEAAGDFRRYTQSSLRSVKRGALRSVIAALDESGGRVVLAEPAAAVWIAALNDLRLALGTRLGVDEDLAATAAQLAEDDPRLHQLAVYEWLGLLQESLVSALAAGGWAAG